ncbi:PAS domain-containing protein [Tundrisphaera sp. TA3]|uniref:hybrid sensor histidine kinase/response regulator n=1 Tax=Tundrisphaera sp. TA3 TaxID=3435775 RepID=UPI003EB7968A
MRRESPILGVAEDPHRSGEEQFRLMADAIPQIVWVTDADGRTEFFNRQWEAYTGVPYEPTTAPEVAASFLHPDDGPPTMAAFTEARRSGSTFRVEHRIRSRRGDYRWFLVRAEPYRDPESGEIVRWFGTSTDIHDAKLAEASLARSERRFRALVTATSDVIYQLNPDWSLLQPLDGRGLIPSNDEPIRNWIDRNVPAFEHERLREAIGRAIATRQPFSLEHRTLRPDGTLGWTYSRAVPVLDAAGEIIEWFGAASDISRSKGIEAERERLKEESDRQRLVYEAALSNTPDLVYIFDLDHRFAYANEALLAMWGRTREESLGKNCLELGYEPWHAELHDREIEQVVRTRAPIRGVVPFNGTNGRRMYDYIFVPVLGAGGEVVAVAGTTRDVTDLKESEAELRRGEGRLAAALSAASLGTFEWDVATDLMTLDDRCREIFGFGPGEGTRAGDLFARIHPEDLARVAAESARSRDSMSRLETEYRIVLPGGAVRRVLSINLAVPDPGGKSERMIGVFGDVTDRRRDEEELRSSEERFRFLDTLGQATRSADDAGEIMATTARLLGEHLEATRTAYATVDADSDRFVIHQDWTAPGAASTAGAYSLDLFGPRAAADMRGGRTLVIRDVDAELDPGGGADMFNAIGIKAIVCCPLVKDGRLVAMMAAHQATPRPWSNAEVALVEEVVERSWAHIERVRAAEVLRENDRRKDEFLAMLAHELRNPLSAIGNAVQVVRRSDAREDLEWAKEVIGKHVGSLSRMIDDLLDVSRITRGKIELKRRKVDMLALVASAVETVRPLVEERRHELTVSHSTAPMWVDADPHRIEQVLVNLLTNAAKYTEAGGRITLAARPDGGSVAVAVSDNGTGIPPEKIPQMFELFAQGDRSIARSEGGLGIGLTLVKNLVEMHGGSVIARSEGVARGSEFTVRLPAVAAPEAGRPGASRPAEGSPAKGARVLVVDDNEDSARGLARLLKVLGNQVEVASDGPTALGLAGWFAPDFVLLDIGLPGMDGYEVARRLRADGLAGTTIIAVSGYGEEAARSRAREAGFDHHLVKPLDYETLVAIMRAGR